MDLLALKFDLDRIQKLNRDMDTEHEELLTPVHAASDWPSAALPPAIPFTFQFTPVFEVPLTCAVSVTR
jgi:hypothetical protein